MAAVAGVGDFNNDGYRIFTLPAMDNRLYLNKGSFEGFERY